MDDMEKKEEMETVAAEAVEEMAEAAEEAAEEMTEAAEEAAEEMPAEEPVQKETEKGGSNIIGIVIGFVLLIAFMAVCWMSPMGSAGKDTGVFYAKDNDLYFYDMKNEPYLVQEDISAGGTYHYYYSAWGASVAENGDWAYYTVNIDENGMGDLYRRSAKNPSAEAALVDSDVYDYMTSKDGSVVAYLVYNDGALQLRTYAGDENRTVVTDNVVLEDDVYDLSADGRYLVYKDENGWLNSMEVQNGGHVNVNVLADYCPLYALAENTLYFVTKDQDVFSIYSYDFKNEPVLVAENAQYMSLMPNGKDLLYGVMPTEKIPYSALVEDDMAEIDAAMTEDDPNYDQKLMRDEIRAAVENGEGLEPFMMEYYLLSNGKETLIADQVVSAVAVDSEQSFIAGYKAKEFQPLYLSVIGGGLEMVDMIYYMSLNYGGMDAFLADANGNVEVLAGSGVLPDSIKVSSDGRKVAYLATDETTGGNVLMQAEWGNMAEAEVVQTNVESFAFIGGNGPLCYYYDYANGVGTLGSAESERTITDAAGVEFAQDVKNVYYLVGINGSTGNGQMQHWDGKGEPVIVDGGVFAFQYKGNGKAAVLFAYDVLSQIGDLGYYDGKGVTMLDEDITALFMY